MLKVDALSKHYETPGGLLPILSDVSFMKDPGEALCIMGPSGSGKSTLLLMLGGMLSPSGGKVLFEAESLYDLSPNERARLRRRNIGFVFQQFNLVPYLTAQENVQVPLYLAGVASPEQEARATALLERVGLGDRRLSALLADQVSGVSAIGKPVKLIVGLGPPAEAVRLDWQALAGQLTSARRDGLRGYALFPLTDRSGRLLRLLAAGPNRKPPAVK